MDRHTVYGLLPYYKTHFEMQGQVCFRIFGLLMRCISTSGLDESRAHRPIRAYGLEGRGMTRVFDTPV